MANLRDLAICGGYFALAGACTLVLVAAMALGAYRLGQAQELEHQIAAAHAFDRSARP